MPLSDREKRILSDIEARLRADDPKFARTVSTTTVSSRARHQVKLAVAGLVLGFLLLFGIILHIGYGIAGFIVMLVSAIYGGNTLKRLGDGGGVGGGPIRGGLRRYLNSNGDHDDEPRA
jgi:hypothetical protein